MYVTRGGTTITSNKATGHGEKFDIPQPHPLPMPEYGGYFAPLTEYLPDSSQPISGFHRQAFAPTKFYVFRANVANKGCFYLFV